MYTIVINNHKFENKALHTIEGSDEDVNSLPKLADYGLKFCVCSENCKAEEMNAILTVVASSVKIKDTLQKATKIEDMSEALEKFSSDVKIKNTLEMMTTEKCKTALEIAIKREEIKKMVLKVLEEPLSKKYHGMMVFIMTHGGEGGKLYGSDGEPVTVKDLATLFNASNCEVLSNKPKLFIIQACRGGDQDRGAWKVGGSVATSPLKNLNPTFGKHYNFNSVTILLIL